MKKIFFITLFLIGLMFVVEKVRAADYSLTCIYEAGCSSSLSAFFPTTEIWYPGKILTKTVRFTNDSSITRRVGVRAINTTTSGDIDRVIEFVITKSDSIVLFSNSLHTFYAAGEVTLLDNLAPHMSETFSFKATMYPAANNGYQSKMTQFDLIIGFISSPTNQDGQIAGVQTSLSSQETDVWKYILIGSPVLLTLLFLTVKLCKKNKKRN